MGIKNTFIRFSQCCWHTYNCSVQIGSASFSCTWCARCADVAWKVKTPIQIISFKRYVLTECFFSSLLTRWSVFKVQSQKGAHCTDDTIDFSSQHEGTVSDMAEMKSWSRLYNLWKGTEWIMAHIHNEAPQKLNRKFPSKTSLYIYLCYIIVC